MERACVIAELLSRGKLILTEATGPVSCARSGGPPLKANGAREPRAPSPVLLRCQVSRPAPTRPPPAAQPRQDEQPLMDSPPWSCSSPTRFRACRGY